MGRTIVLRMSSGGAAEAYLARPDDAAHPGVLLFIDALGLRPQIQAMADRIASWGYVVLAPNTLYRSGTAEQTRARDLHAPGAREAFFEIAMPRVHALTTPLAEMDIADYLDALTALPGVRTPIGVTGYCMGARLAMRAANQHPGLVAACGGFHGGGLASEATDSPHHGLGDARAEFVFGHADVDASMPPEAVARLDAALAAAGLAAHTEVKTGARHGYTMADSPIYDEAASEWHFGALRELFGRALPG